MDSLIIGYDISKNKDHESLIISRCEENVMKVLFSFQDEDARFIYNLITGTRPSIDNVIFQLKKYYNLQEIAIISGILRQLVLSEAGSLSTISYLENGSLLR